MRKDVKTPFDIPGIEKIHNLTFEFDFHEPGDRTTGFSFGTMYDNSDIYRIVISTSESFTILKKMKLSDLLTLDGIEYLSFDYCQGDNDYHYRPLVDDLEKDF